MKCLDLPRALLSAGAGSPCQCEWLFGAQVIIYCWSKPKAMLLLAAHSPWPPTGNVFRFQIPLWPKKKFQQNSNKHSESLLFCREKKKQTTNLTSLGLKWNILWLIYFRTGLGSVCCMWGVSKMTWEKVATPYLPPTPLLETPNITNMMFSNKDCKRVRCLILLFSVCHWFPPSK